MTENKVISCRAAICWAPNEPLTVEDVLVDPPKAGEVRVKIVASGICFSDISGSRGKILDVKFPILLGHEAAGIVESVGEGVTRLAVGDHVITLFLPQCNKCRVCKDPDANTCDELFAQISGVMPDGTSRMTCKGKPVYTFLGTSTFAEYTVTKECNLVKINPKAPLEKVCLLSCGVPTGYGAPLKTVKVKPGSTCAVWGLGTIGLGTILGCAHAGAGKIIGIDINPSKFAIAKELGATDFLNPKDLSEPIEAYLKKNFECVDYTFEAIGQIPTMEAAFNSAAFGTGKCCIIGVSGQTERLSIDPVHFLFGKTLTGEAFGSFKGVDDVPKLVEDYMNGKIPLEKFITHNIPFEEINDGFNLLKEGKCIRTVVNFK